MNSVWVDPAKASQWLDQREEGGQSIFYSSVDIRRGAGRICPVDVNLFPAGFNNLCKTDVKDTPASFRQALERRGIPKGAAVGVVAESHTRNPYYAEHLHALVGLIREAGYLAEVSCPECADDVVVQSSSGQILTLLPIHRRADKILFGADFAPDLLLLNNDLAAGVPLLLKNVSQPVVPAFGYGWFHRRKHRFFEIYSKLADEFCSDFSLDPRTINPLSLRVAEVDFKNKIGLDRIAGAVETVLEACRRWYGDHGLGEVPTALIKSNYGTYGMAIASVTDPDQILHINRKLINKLHVGKGKVQTTEVIVQEGIPTDDAVENGPAEPVVYLVGGRPVGAFFRHHAERDNTYNLNVSGMAFKPICLHDQPASDPMSAALVIARLATIAAAREPAEVKD